MAINSNNFELTCYNSVNNVIIGITALRVVDKTINAVNQLLPKTLPALTSASKAIQISYLISALLIPVHLYKITQLSKSNELIQTKTINILMEMGNIFAEGTLVISWFANNVAPQLAKSIPYLIGIALLFQSLEIYKLGKDLHQLKQYNSEDKIAEFYTKIQGSLSLDQEDAKILQAVFKIEADRLDEVYTKLKNRSNEETAKNSLKGRVKKSITSQRVQLSAAVIETLASGLMLGSVLAAPVALPLLIANATLLGTGTALRVTANILDAHNTTDQFINSL